MYRAVLAWGAFGQREHQEAFAVRRKIQVRCPKIEELLVRPETPLAGHERSAIHFVIHRHDLVVGSLVKQLAAIVRPERIETATSRNPPLASTCSREWPDVDLGAARFIG